MSPSDLMAAITQHNAGRDPQRLAMKYVKMAESPFAFLRGACHLFYAALPDSGLFRDVPLAWNCGDAHFENFGSYKGDNRQVYFDINDYDEAALAPVTWDIVRLLTSLQCGADALNATPAEAQAVSESCLAGYRSALTNGKPLWVETETANGLVKDLLLSLQTRERAKFLDKRTKLHGRQRRLLVDGTKALPATEAEKAQVQLFMTQFAAQQNDPKFFQVLDIARRIAGTGSLGVARFVVLVNGKDSPDGNYLIDLKIATPSALIPALQQRGIVQPAWADQAERVVAIQNRMQSVNHAFLHAVKLDGTPYILRGLQPSEDRVSIGEWGKKISRLHEVATTMGRILAWDQLRASGRAGAACADALIDFASGTEWTAELLNLAQHMTEVTRQQYEDFKQAWRKREGQ